MDGAPAQESPGRHAPWHPPSGHSSLLWWSPLPNNPSFAWVELQRTSASQQPAIQEPHGMAAPIPSGHGRQHRRHGTGLTCVHLALHRGQL
jgi:hypothetical protein